MSYYFKAGMIDPKYVARAKRHIKETGEPYFGSPTPADSTRLGRMMATATPRLSGQAQGSDDCVTAVLHTDETCGLVCINQSGDTGYTWRQHLESRGVDLKKKKARTEALDNYDLDESELDDDIPKYTLAEIDPELAVQSRVWSAFGVLRPILRSPFFVESRTNEPPADADVELGELYLADGAPGMNYEGFHASSFLAVSLLHYCITALDSEIELEFEEGYPDL